jgi:hypothetical protein
MTIFQERIDCSIRALVKCGFIGLSQIGEIDGLVIAWREVNVAQHLVAVGAFAFDVHCEGGTLSFPTKDSAETKRRVDVAIGYRNPRHIGPITRAGRVFRVRSNNRESVFSEHWRCERRKRDTAQHFGQKRHLFHRLTYTLLPTGHQIGIAAIRGDLFGSQARSENKRAIGLALGLVQRE